MRLRQLLSAAGIAIPAFALSGCERAPSIDIVGSFFPVWIFCIIAGVALSVLARLLFIRLRVHSELGPPVIVYPSLAALLAFSIWLIFFRF